MTPLRKMRRRAGRYLLAALGPLAAALLAALTLSDGLAAGAGEGGAAGMFSMAARLRRLLPATVNHTDGNGPLYSGQYAPRVQPRPEELVVVTYNLHYGDAVSAAQRAFGSDAPRLLPDFLLLQEADAADVETLAAALSYDYVYCPASVAPDGDDFGNAILSRWPLSDPKKIILPGLHPLSGQQRTATRATARVGGADVLVYSTHIEIATAPAELRVGQMAAVAADVPPEATAVIVGGDFNVVTGRGVRALAGLYAANQLTHASRDVGPTLTRLGVHVAADHLFVRGFDVATAGVLNDVTGSDHQPVWARLSWQ